MQSKPQIHLSGATMPRMPQSNTTRMSVRGIDARSSAPQKKPGDPRRARDASILIEFVRRPNESIKSADKPIPGNNGN